MDKENKELETVAENAERAYVYCGFSQPDHNRLGSVAHHKIPPYNTGKVLIGCLYQPQPKYNLSLDSERLQRALLDNKQARDARTEALFMRWLYGIALVGLFVIIATR